MTATSAEDPADRVARRVAAPTLLLVAGFVDAIAFVYLQANFVSFMSGNTTVLGASSSMGKWSDAGTCAALIVLFFLGVTAGSVVNRVVARPRQWLSWAVFGGLVVGAAVATAEPGVAFSGGLAGAGTVGMLVVAVATGMINAVFEKDSRMTYGLTYVTGTLVTAARQLADAVVARSRRDVGGPGQRAWIISLGMWALLALGAVAGGLCYRWISLSALWIPAGALLVVAIVMTRAPAPGAVTPAGRSSGNRTPDRP